jgi:aryl-alcohol dehydrogenase-like predicted oxidoreductase
LKSLGRAKLDLYLVHWPGAQGLKRDDPQNGVLRRESWKALEELLARGKCKWSIKLLLNLHTDASLFPLNFKDMLS